MDIGANGKISQRSKLEQFEQQNKVVLDYKSKYKTNKPKPIINKWLIGNRQLSCTEEVENNLCECFTPEEVEYNSLSLNVGCTRLQYEKVKRSKVTVEKPSDQG